MQVEYVIVKGSWRDVADAARTTIHLPPGVNEPPSDWKYRMLLAEHSPIRQMSIKAKWTELPYWVSTHFVRHKIGIEHWVRTQRSDRTGIDRNIQPQDSLVEHEILATAQALINISRRRLCRQASAETQQAWNLFLQALHEQEPELAAACVPECIYRGWCPEYRSCGYHTTGLFKEALSSYRGAVNTSVNGKRQVK